MGNSSEERSCRRSRDDDPDADLKFREDRNNHGHKNRGRDRRSRRDDDVRWSRDPGYEGITDERSDHSDPKKETSYDDIVRRSYERSDHHHSKRDRSSDEWGRRVHERSDHGHSKRESSYEERERSHGRSDHRHSKRERSHEERERSHERSDHRHSKRDRREKRKHREESEDIDQGMGKKLKRGKEESRRRRRSRSNRDEEISRQGTEGVTESEKTVVKEKKFKDVSGSNKVAREKKPTSSNLHGSSPTGNGPVLDSLLRPSPHDLPPHPWLMNGVTHPNLKVTENKGVSVIGSHEVHGKSSTDDAAADVAKRSLSLDAISKAKKALQKQKELSEKLKHFPLFNSKRRAPAAESETRKNPLPPLPCLVNKHNIEAVKRAQELAAKMGFRQDPEFAPLINMFPGEPSLSTAVLDQKPAKAPVLLLDSLGREIDDLGHLINMPKPNALSTLKVNINKQRKDAFQILKPELEFDPESNRHFDSRMGIDKSKLVRPKKTGFQFVEEGKWSRDAELVRLKSQYGEAQARELRAKQAQLARAEPGINPNLIEVSERVVSSREKPGVIPDVEWWDVPFLHPGGAPLRTERITIYVEHPRPVEPPSEPPPPPPQPLKLTKKEQKKLRTQRRLGRERDRQEMIRQGLIEPPKPKVKMSNLMKVLGSEATQDPTRLEMEIRAAAAERERAHADRNTARKLTPSERRQKKERKLFDDSAETTAVALYRADLRLSHPQTRFKVDVNAQENRLSGSLVISDSATVVVVEGGAKSISRYTKLMLRRIDWRAAGDDDGATDGDRQEGRRCVLVWQGDVARPAFNRFNVHECRTAAAARKVFADAGVGHYWDLAVNTTTACQD